MKAKLKKLMLAVLIVFGSLLLATCFNPLEDEDGMASFSINLSGNNNSKAAIYYPPNVYPDAMAQLMFKAIFVPAGEGTAKEFSSEGNDSITGMIASGTYNVSMEINLLSNGSPYAKGEAVGNPVTINSGSGNIINIEVEQLKFTVSFDLNGGSGTTPSLIADIPASHDTPLPAQGDILRTGHAFSGWNTRPDGSGTNYEAGSSFTPIADITLYARWLDVGLEPFIAVTATGLTSLKVGQAASGASIVYTLTNGTYASPITAANFAVSGLPAGLTGAAAVRTSGTIVTINITGIPTTYSASAATLVAPLVIPQANVTGATSAITLSGTITASAVARGDGAAVSGAPTANGTPTQTSIAVNAVTIPVNPGGQTVQYAINQSNTITPTTGWQSGTTFNTGLTAGTTYYVWARSAANTNYNAGTARVSTAISTAAAPIPAIAVTATAGLTAGLKVGQAVRDASIVYTLSNGAYAASITAANFNVTGLPAGLTGAATRTSDTVVTLNITGTPTTYSATGTNITIPTIPAANVSDATANITPTGTVTTSAVARGDGAEVSGEPTVNETPTHNTMVVGAVTLSPVTGQLAEYALVTSQSDTLPPPEGWFSGWQTSTTFTDLTPATTYHIWARSAENQNYNAGTPVRSSYGFSTERVVTVGPGNRDPFASADYWIVAFSITTIGFYDGSYSASINTQGLTATGTVEIENNRSLSDLTFFVYSASGAGTFNNVTLTIDGVTSGPFRLVLP